jgi:D-serine deaminase-like pyridoxal phosphate-dependent protein
MAEYFAADYKDITLALPLNLRAFERINALAHRTGLTLLLSKEDAARALVKQIKAPVRVFIELDAGYHRTGIAPEQHGEIASIIQILSASPFTSFRGFYIHPGNSYGLDKLSAKQAIHEQALRAIADMKRIFHREGMDYRLGDTPNCTLMEDFGELTSIGPGNYVFYDAMMARYGNCSWSDIAVCLAAPILEAHPSRQELIGHGGAVHLSKDLMEEADGTKHYGWISILNNEGWSEPLQGAYVKKLSQEHGIIHLPKPYFDALVPGGLLGILPVHSCLTASCMKGYLSDARRRPDHAEA